MTWTPNAIVLNHIIFLLVYNTIMYKIKIKKQKTWSYKEDIYVQNKEKSNGK